MLKTTILPKIIISSDKVTRQRTEITLMSYDKNVHQIKIPTDLTESEISRVLVLFTFPRNKSVIQIAGAWADGYIQFELPDAIRGYRGTVYVEIDIDLTSDRQITFARYRLQSELSDIDNILDRAQTVYFELFEDFVAEVADKSQQAKDVIDAQTDSVKMHVNQVKQAMDSDVNDVHDYGASAKSTIDGKVANATAEINADVNNIEQAKLDALTAIDTDINSVDSYANAKKLVVDGLVSDASASIDGKVVSVEQSKNQALASIDTDKQDVANTTSQFKSDLSDTQTTIDNQVNSANNALNQLDTSLTGLNNKMDLANTTADNVIADATAKGQAVTTKYNEFDANVTQANQTIDSILALQDNANVTLKNSVLNGLDFAQNWTGKQADLSVTDNVLTKTPTAIGSYVNSVTPLNYTDKFYMTSLVKTADNKLRHMTSFPNASNYHSGSGQFERLSSILNIEDTAGDVGGRNLIISSEFYPMALNLQFKGTEEIYVSGTAGLKGWARLHNSSTSRIDWILGQSYTLSFEVRGNKNFITGISISDSSGANSEFTDLNFTVTTDNIKHKITFVFKGMLNKPTSVLRLFLSKEETLTENREMWISKLKLEKGATATPWTPAPEDGIELQWAKSSNDTLLPAEIKQPHVINLTQVFGVGNEPTKSEMDELLKVLGGWFDGEITLTQKQQLTWLLNLIRKNTMTITALGGSST